MSKRILYLLFALSIGLNVGVIGTTLTHKMSEPRKGPPRRNIEGTKGRPGQKPDPANLVEEHLFGMTQHLGLSEEQQDSIRKILEQHAPRLSELQNAMAESGPRLAEAYSGSGFDAEAFRELAAEISANRSQLDSLSTVVLVAEAAVLTPEQRLKFSYVVATIHTGPQPGGRKGGPPREGGPPPGGRPPRK